MNKKTRILYVRDQPRVWPRLISLPQYETRARRCSACQHRTSGEQPMCSLLPNQPPFNRGIAVVMSDEQMACPEGRWADENAPEADIIEELKPMDPPSSMMQRIAHGATGLAKAAMGLDRSDDATIATRYALCMACDRHALGVCTACGCLCAAKVRVAGEACPEGKWSATAPARSS